MRLKPSSDDKKTIRAIATQAAGRNTTTLRPSVYWNAVTDKKSINALLFGGKIVESFGWERFSEGVHLTPDGAMCVDFAVYETAGERKLMTNIQVYYEDFKMDRITEGDRELWPAS